MKKTLVSIIAVTVTCLCCVVGSTFAWLVARANPISNTFTVGNVDIMLSDQTAPHKIMVPGATYTENQTVTVLAGSEDCWIFVHAHEENWAFVDTRDGNHSSDFISFDYAEGWTLLEDTIDVYYRKVTSSAESQAFPIIKNNTITVNPNTTKAQYDTINTDKLPTITFTAYAVQCIGFDTPALAWEEAKKLGFI